MTQLIGQGEKYKLKDTYDFTNHTTIGYYNTMEEVKKACKNWEMDTDNECYFELRQLNDKNKYSVINEWMY